MKTILLICVGLALVISGWMLNTGRADKKKEAWLRHIVLFKFTSETSPTQVEAIVQAFGELPGKIREIQEFEWGPNVSHEDRSKGLTHCFLVTFRSEAELAAYLVHPEHVKFVELLKPSLADVTVVDYWVQ